MARKSDDSGGWVFKGGLFAVLAGLAFWIFNRNATDTATTATPPIQVPNTETSTPNSGTTSDTEPDANQLPVYAPNTNNEVVRHQSFTLAYSEDNEQAEWVCYEITREQLNKLKLSRTGISFKPDPKVSTKSATPRDYNNSGYDRGHLCAAADMSFDSVALAETFYMSNISPQIRAFNAGIWREMEELQRDWAREFGRVYIVVGPMLSRPGIKEIGENKVTVPIGFFKVLYAPAQEKAIGFIIPNQMSDKPVMDYAFDLNYVEKMTGIDFFPQLLQGEKGERIESTVNKPSWKVNPKRFTLRVQEWNN